ncbi:LysR family transcriptional regulator [Saccharopolyspora hirsuta]|uniref:LysR family transcriptional regulator n=1 Tax=Saccharopolyspora hirsuta TaxID=1837 RepID=A0A5M7BSD6_SACHI|nr:LysR family transcriptional regulator [Saccharopolyspora hirsuta]KAA5830154.1 LysR family transcriptional regulator [Saccharopolyspora hirsuta]MBF6507391.1 LysR family transcriptional regulator [Nocardia farcinica]
MEMFHLRYFVAVAENLSFSKAARQLHMATSPLSQRVRDLERDLGSVLFERDSHHVQLTEAGAALLPIAKDVLGRFDDIPWRLREAISPPRPVVYVGIPPGLHSALRDRLRTFEQRCAAGCDIKRWPGGSSDLLAGVQRGELAMALVHLPVHAEGIEVFEVMREPLGAVLPAAEFGARTSVSLHELVDHTYVSPAARMLPSYYDEVEARLRAAGIHRRMTLDTGDYGSTSEFVANGSAFSISMLDPESGMWKHRSENTVVLPFEDFDPALATGLIWRQDRTETHSDLRRLIDEAKLALSGPTA